MALSCAWRRRLDVPTRAPCGRSSNLRIVARAEGVARVLAFGDGRDFESGRKFGRQVLQRMHGEIDAAGGESFFDLFGENSFAKSALGADHGQGDVGDFVAGGVDDLDFDFMAARAQQRGDVVRLPEGELRAAGADAEFRHGIGKIIHLMSRGFGESGISMKSYLPRDAASTALAIRTS